jgi:NTE family protein
LVLGGGGSAGNAWLIGVVAGLFEAGLDVTTAELTVGTSAGSTTAVQLAGATPPELISAILDAAPQHPPGPVGPDRGRAPANAVTDRLEFLQKIIASADDAAAFRLRMGAAALAADAESGGAWTSKWRAVVSARLPDARWSDRRMLLTAVDARTGEPVVFDRHSGVDVIDAVAASTAGGGSPYSIGAGKYIDGGYRSNAENADLTAGYGRVLVLSPLGGRSLHPLAWGTHLASQVEDLRTNGSVVETIFPAHDSEHLFGANAMNPSLRPPAARAGYDQGKDIAARLTEFWQGATA